MTIDKYNPQARRDRGQILRMAGNIASGIAEGITQVTGHVGLTEGEKIHVKNDAVEIALLIYEDGRIPPPPPPKVGG